MAAKKAPAKIEEVKQELNEVNEELNALDEEQLTDDEIEEIAESKPVRKKGKKSTKKVEVEEDEEIEEKKSIKDRIHDFGERHPKGCKIAKKVATGVAVVGSGIIGYCLGKEDAFAACEFLEDNDESVSDE